MITSHGTRRQTATRFSLAFTLMAALLASLFSLGSARAAVNVNSIQAYQQNFSSLISTGSAPWQNDVTLKGWYAAAGSTDITSYTAFPGGAGTSFPAGLYSFGSGNDRALGLISSSTNTPKRMGVVLKNTTGVPLDTITIAYTGEQWLDANTITSTLQFKYKTNATSGVPLGAADIKTGTGLALLTALDFTGPQHAAAGPIDGNLPANSQRLTQTIDLSPNLPNNNEIFLVWEDDNISGNDHGLAVDDLSVTATLIGNAPAQATCPSPLTVFQGSETGQAISAVDPDGVISGATITSGGAAGITLNQTPATSAGGTYTAKIAASLAVAPGTYNLVIQFQNATTSAQTATCNVTLNVNPAPTDLAVSKDGPVEYRPGQQLTYNIMVNPGPAPATNVILTDTLPADLTYVSSTSGVTPTISGQNVVWNFGTLSAPTTFDLVAASSAATSGTITNTATVSTSSVDPDPANNTDTAVTTQRPPAPDFSGSRKSSEVTTVQVGDVFAYTITVSNSGDLAGTYALTDTLPANVSLVSAPGLTEETNGTLTAGGSIAAGQVISYTVNVQADAVGDAENNVTLTGDGTTHTLTAIVVVAASATPADFSGSTKLGDVTQAAAGDEVVYTITLSNSGQLQGTFLLTDTLDANLTLVSAPGMVVNGQTLRTSGTVNGGQTREYVIVARINANTPRNTVIRNSADVLSNGQSYTLTASDVIVKQGAFEVHLPMIQKLP